MIILFLPVLVLESINRQAYPLYFIPLIGLTSLVPQYLFLNVMVWGIFLGASLSYVPYLYAGVYSPTVSYWENILFIIPLVSVIVLNVILFSIKRLNVSK